MNWAPTLSNPHIVSIQWCSERSQGALNGRSWSSQPLHPTDGIQHPGAHSERSVLFPVAAPTVCSLHSPANHCTVIHGWKNHYPCWTGSPLVRLRCGEAWPASQTLFASVPTSSKPVYTSFPLYECIAGKIHGLPIAELQSSFTLASIWLSQFLQSMRKRPGEKGRERSAWCLLGLSSAAAIWFPFHVVQKGLNGIRGNLEFLGYFSVVCPRWSEEEGSVGMALACQYMPVAKPLQKPSEALLMNCASGSPTLHGVPIRAFQLDSSCNCYGDEMLNVRRGS